VQVGDALLETIFDPDADSAGLVIDGFPRTALQVELLKQLYDKMMSLHVQNADTPNEWRFPRPSFKVTPPTPPHTHLKAPPGISPPRVPLSTCCETSGGAVRFGTALYALCVSCADR